MNHIATSTHPFLNKKMKRLHAASGDIARQVESLRTIVRDNHGRLDALWIESGEEDGPVQPAGSFMFYEHANMEERVAQCRKRHDTEVLTELDRASALGPLRTAAVIPDADACKPLLRDFPHMAAAIEIIARRLTLAKLAGDGGLWIPPILLSGPPGVGKTAFAREVSDLFDLPFRRIDVAGETTGFALTGSHPTWSQSRAGMVWDLLQSPHAAGVILLDEIDKAGRSNYPVLGGLYALLEQSTARRFRDGFVDLAIDATRILWIATCNKPDELDSPIRDRFVEVAIDMPSDCQMPQIVASIHRQLRERAPWSKSFGQDLPDAVISALSFATPREITRLLEDAYARAAMCGRRELQASDVPSTATSARHRRVGFI